MKPGDRDAAPGSRRTPSQSRSRALVRAIVEAAGRIVAESGAARVSTNHVARVAGVSVG